MLVISSREFREKQAMYLDHVDEGTEILVQRGKNKSYRIIPVTKEDSIVKKEHILAPDERLTKEISPHSGLLFSLHTRKMEKSFI